VRCLVIAMALLALAAPLAHAQPGPAAPVPPPAAAPPPDKGASPDEKAVARQHFQKAKELHEKKRYAEAAAEYLEAYRHLPMPAFLYNAGQVFRLGGEKQKALDYYKKYLELEPEGEGAADAKQFIAELTAAIEAENKARGGGEEGALPPPPGGSGEGAGDRDTGEKPGRGLMIAGLVSGGIGVAALGAAVVFAARAGSAESDLDGYRGTWTPEQRDRYAEGESAERNMTVSLVVGAVALGAGGTMFFLGRQKARRAAGTPTFSASAGGGAAHLWVGGSF